MLLLMDSGATIHAGEIKKYFPQYSRSIKRSRAQDMGATATSAGGHALKYEGKCRIDGDVEGMPISVMLNNMKVDIPILSVRKLVKDGFDICFTESGGYIKARDDGKKVQLIEADGAYWLKMKVNPPDDPMGEPVRTSVFSRPGP